VVKSHDILQPELTLDCHMGMQGPSYNFRFYIVVVFCPACWTTWL